MENSYRYIDPDFKYTNKNGVLYNLANIENEDVLAVFESLKVSKRLEELYENPIQIIDSESLIYIHRYLFQDVYEWAGKTRTVNISKDGKPFFEGERFETGFKYVNSLITDFKNIEINDKRKIARTLAEILDNVNFLHPFREGNGRTQREFLRLLALEKGFTLNLNPPDNKEIFERYMNGTINSDVEVLSHLIFEIIN
ncbi:MAG: Fic family protein [Bacteroidetes bacterium]|nr:Fic family protein [Bacteroidota bacterium]MBX7238081.1 Fic family protein [Bacteroidia bacterium]MCC7514059.1 Fic family protein [Bacteroidia bacterium]MCW5919254.1 Fic family protein [Bacteroidota bacterium]HCI58151.1 filamentation induced by camp protein fic [Bacteroidota bacterium]